MPADAPWGGDPRGLVRAGQYPEAAAAYARQFAADPMAPAAGAGAGALTS